MAFGRAKQKIIEDRHCIDIDGREVPLLVRRHPRAKRMILRVNTKGEGVVITVPKHLDPDDGLDMARRQSAWITEHLDRVGERTPFADGASVPFLGRDHLIRHRPEERGTVWLDGCEIHVAGNAEHLSRRVTDWMKKQARSRITTLAHDKAERLEKDLKRITIRDTRTRWGSCSFKGCLSFSWRLILTPQSVLDYVVAHEVSHLAHMDHSKNFWRTVDTLTGDAQASRDWLSTHGGALHRIG